MRLSRGSKQATKEPLGASSLEDWPSYLENSPGETMRPLYRASLKERISAYGRTQLALDAGFILLLALIAGVVFVSMLRI